MTPDPQAEANAIAVAAEMKAISCCFIDGESVRRCLSLGLEEREFLSAANRTIYSQILSVYNKSGVVDMSIVAQELKKAGMLAEVGGYPYLMQVSESNSTTLQLEYFVGEVKEASLKRDVTRNAMWAIGKIKDGVEAEEVIAHLTTEIARMSLKRVAISPVRSIGDFQLPPDDDHTQLLGGNNRYVTRGQSCIIVSSSGMGKSALSLQAAVTFSRAMPFFGIQCKKPLRSLVIQAEDDDGDIAEVWESILHENRLNMSPEEELLVRERVLIVRDRVNRGDAFISHMAALCKEHKPDLVWINPLQNYVDGDIADKATIGRFLSGLNKANANDLWAYFIVHHTTKPPAADGKGTKPRQWNEMMYDMAGSSALIDWARAIMILKATATEGEFNLHLAKRGTRAGVVEQTALGVKPTTVIPLKHATGEFQVDGRARKLKTIYWLPRDKKDEVVEEKPAQSEDAPIDPKVRLDGRGEKYSNEQISAFFPSTCENSDSFSSIFKNAAIGSGISKSSFSVKVNKLKLLKWIVETDAGQYKRTLMGDQAARNYLEGIA